MKWLSGFGRKVGELLSGDEETADIRRHRERVVTAGLTRILEASPDKATLRAVLEKQREIDALHRQLAEDASRFDVDSVAFDGLSHLKAFQKAQDGYILVYVQGFAKGLLQQLIQQATPIVSVVFETHEDPSAHRSVLERGHGLAFPLPFFPEDEDAALGEFFGQLTAFSTKAATFALENQAPLLPIWFRLEEGTVTMEIAPAVEGDTVESLALSLGNFFEKRIRHSPAEMDWEADCWFPPIRRVLPSRFPWPLLLPEGRERSAVAPFDILVRVPDTVREACLAVPAVRALKQGRPDVRLTLVTIPEMTSFWARINRDVLALGDESQTVFPLGVMLNREKRAFTDLKPYTIDRLVGMQSHPMADSFDEILNMPRKLGPPEHRHRTYLRVPQRMGAAVEKVPALRLPIIAPIANSAETPGFVAVAPGSADGDTYAWPTERFVQVIQSFQEQSPTLEWKIILLPDAPCEEWDAVSQFPNVSVIGSPPDVDGKLDLLQGGQLIIANDNDLLQLATTCYSMPSIAIYGPSEPIETAPISKGALTLRKHVECTPCFLRDCPLDHRCMTAIEVDEVLAAIESLASDGDS